MNFNEIADALKDSGNDAALRLIKNKLCSTESGKAEYEEAIKERDYYDLQDKLRYVKDIDSKTLELQNIIEIHMDMARFYKDILTQEKSINPKFYPGMAYPLFVNDNANEVGTLLVHSLLNYTILKGIDYNELTYGVPVFHKMSKPFGNVPQISIVFLNPDCKEAEPFMKTYRAVRDTYYRKTERIQ